MLSNATWSAIAQTSNAVEQWVYRLYYDTGDPDGDAAAQAKHIRIASFNSSQGGRPVYGCVTNRPTIRQSIDLEKSRAKIDNISLTCANDFIGDTRLFDEIGPTCGGPRKYVNRKLRIYSYLNGVQASELVIYTGRILSIDSDLETVTIRCEPAQPWDFIEVPNVKAPSGNYFPIVYGDFTPNSSKPDALANSPDCYCPSMALFPAQVDQSTNEVLWCLMPRAYSDDSVRPHFYESSMNRFVPITDAAYAYVDATEVHGDGNRVAVDVRLIHGITIKPIGMAQDSTWPSNFTNPERAFDSPNANDTSTYATATATTTAKEFYLQCPVAEIDVYDQVNAAVQFHIYTPAYFSRHGAPHPTLWLSVDGGSSFVGQYQPTAAGDVTIHWTIDSTELPGGVLPQQIGFYFFISGGTTACECRIKDIRIECISRTSVLVDPGTATAQDIASNDKRARDQALAQKQFYFGCNGLDKTWGPGSSVDEIAELHRDLINRFTSVESEPDNWAAVNNGRDGWYCRYWLHKPRKLKDLLEQAQFEGCFLFAWSPTGTGRYIVLDDSYSAGDEVATLDSLADISSLKYSHVSWDQLVTKREISYQRHPADDSRYLQSYTFTNSAARTSWNIQTDENIQQVKLDMLTDKADDHAAYYDRLTGDLHQLVNCDVLAFRHYLIEVGDIVCITGDSRFYVLTDIRRGEGSMAVSMREVG